MQAENLDYKDRLLASVKKEVKQLMEEAVTKKIVHEESGSVTSLCGAVEACLSSGLRRRALGLFKTSSTTALLHKVAKHNSDAASISKKVQELENTDTNKRSSSSSDSTTKPPILKKNSSSNAMTVPTPNAPTVKYLWIRLALFEKKLSRIIDHLVINANRYYERDSLVADPDYGSILSSLLVGPCALEYSRVKTADHFWTDPPADELIQRHRISSGHQAPSTCRTPILDFKRSLHTSSEDGGTGSFKSSFFAKDYVESLHQNSRATLLYGKNNVVVVPKEVNEPMPGYLSLHQTPNSLTIKWTPNQLMNGYSEKDIIDKSSFWAYSFNINIDEIVYVHCHQSRGDDTGGTIVLVGQDGVQRPPIHFPEGGHMASFLSCLETGLLPHGQLDPPLWSHQEMGKLFNHPKQHLPFINESFEGPPIDYVFRVVNKGDHQEFLASYPICDIGPIGQWRRTHQLNSCSTSESSGGSSKSLSLDICGTVPNSPQIKAVCEESQAECIALVCTTMRKKIISRAFYGWLAYCRHLSTVRTHLSGLVNCRITPEIGAEEGLTAQRWESLNVDGTIVDEAELNRLVYYGGINHNIRKDVWPYLLGHYSVGSTPKERADLDESTQHYFETIMSEWLAVEAIVRQRDKEKTAHAVAKLSLESGYENKGKDIQMDLDIDNDVFEVNDFSDLSDSEEHFNDKDQYENDTVTYGIGCRTNIKPNRANKSSTDSGNVADVDVIKMDEPIFEVWTSQDQTVLSGTNDMKDEIITIVTKSNESTPSHSSYETVATDFVDIIDYNQQNQIVEAISDPFKDDDVCHSFILTDDTKLAINLQFDEDDRTSPIKLDSPNESGDKTMLSPLIEEQPYNSTLGGELQEPKSACVSPASSNGGIYSGELLETFGQNLHRIEKDVQRCDRNYWYFANENLDKLRNVICTYVWEHLEIGYMQGMCDLVAPLLVIFDDESLSYACFCRLMDRMIENFPNGGAMDIHFANMRSLIQILDSEMYDLMHVHGDYTHFYFCYRWFLLDFKRELVYTDIFSTWERIWAAKHVASPHFVLFIALALLETYRDIILSNCMDFTDVIKFFNEMAERHNMNAVLKLSRSLVLQLQTILENK